MLLFDFKFVVIAVIDLKAELLSLNNKPPIPIKILGLESFVIKSNRKTCVKTG
ncbi:MAG: hypothetical protein LBF33_02795 [Oscillospiraceae bacterium]|jgi:hypothetical protein|nr:hypothetical protein [Oscillospiraceae bacterium]